MTLLRVPFRAVQIRDFRGFQRLQRIELDASVVLIVGPNGTGKTSFFDALQWLLTGDLPRLRDRAARRKAEYIVNQWSTSGEAEVAAELMVGGQLVRARRTGTSAGSTLELTDEQGETKGPSAERSLASMLLAAEEVALQEALPATGMLQQDVLRSVIESEPTKRYEQLAKLLGLEELPAFEEATRKRADLLRREVTDLRSILDQRESELLNLESNFQRLSAQMSASQTIAELQEEVETRLRVDAPAVELVRGFPKDAREISRLANSTRRLRDRFEHLVAVGRKINPEFLPRDSLELSLASATTQEEELRLRLQEIEAVISAAVLYLRESERNTEQMQALAALALPLLADSCPICDQPIERSRIHDRLLGIAEAGHSDLLARRNRLAELQGQRELLLEQSRTLMVHREEMANELQRVDGLNQERHEWFSACAALAHETEDFRIVDIANVRSGIVESLDAAWRALGEIERATRDAISVLSAHESTQSIEELRGQLTELAEDIERLRQSVAAASREATEARKIAHATADAVAKVASQRLTRLAPLLGEIYSRFDPHPAFTSLEYGLDLYRRRAVAEPIVVDDERGNRADPVLVFSSSQTNVVALTFFLAMSWTDGSYSLPFLMLDDPLQAMDDINALGFADLCRHIRTGRQLMVSTQDRRLGHLLERKLAPRMENERTLVIRFRGWDRLGPQIEQEVIEPQLEVADRRVLIAA